MSIDLDSREETNQEDYQQYRALSTAAVAGLLFGLLSSLAMFGWAMLPIPIIGVLVSTYAWHKVTTNAAELTGAKLAAVGLVLSLFFLVAGPALLTFIYYYEIPEGYAPVSYAELQPDPRQAGQEIPPEALALEGKRIFIKGYVYPGQQKQGIRDFLLVRDQGDCCFGGDPRITDRILVSLEGPLRLNYAPRLHKVAGTFHVEPRKSTIDGAKGGVFYHLKADYLK